MSDNYTVYKHISPEGKVYIGCTSVDLERRFQSGYYHNSRFSDDIKRFGWKNFKHEVIATGLNEQEAFDLEKELIHKYDSINPEFGYNISTGGYGRTGCYFSHTEEAKQKIREAGLGRRHTEETKRKLSEARRGEGNPMYGRCGKNNPRYGTHPTEETRKKLCEAKRGENHPFYGKHRSEETRKKLSEAHTGKQVSEITKQKIREANSKKVMCLETGKIYNSIYEAYLNTDIPVSSISAACNGRRKTTHGYHWLFI